MKAPARAVLRRPRHRPRHQACAIVCAVAIVWPLAQGCGGKPKPGGSAVVISASAPAAGVSSGLARWRPAPLPLQRNAFSVGYAFPSASARLHIDQSGTRWLLPNEPVVVLAPSGSASAATSTAGTSRAVPVAAPMIDLDPVEQRLPMPDGDLLIVTRDGRLLKLPSPLAAPVPAIAARLPEGTIASTVRRFRGATTVRATKGLFWSRDGQTFVSVPGLPGYAAGEAILDPAGVGIGLFFPERVAITRDLGKTWTPVALPDAHATQVEHRGDLLVALPGGIRDVFARAIDPLTGQVERTPHLSSGGPIAAEELDLGSLLRMGPRQRRRFRPRPFPAPDEPPPPRYVPGEEPRGFHRGPAIDGDTVLAFEDVEGDRGRRSLRAATGLLGEALSRFGEGALGSCNPRASAICGVRAAIVCEQELLHFRSGAEIGRTAVAADTTVAYDGEGRLWTASPDREKGGGIILLRRFPIDGALPSPGEEHARVLGGSTPRLLGGCHSPALWAVGETAAAKLHGTGFADATSTPKDSIPVGVAAGGSLVMSTGGELAFVPGDRRVAVKPHLSQHISFSEDGQHALLSTPSGQLEQSDDGGQTFRPVPTPPVLLRQAIVCGRTRCLLGPSAIREGFGRDPAATPDAWSVLPRDQEDHEIHRYTRPEERDRVPAVDHFVCTHDAALFAAAPKGAFAVRAGSWLLSTVGEGKGDGDPPQGFFGAVDGTGQSVSLPPRTGRGPVAGKPLSFGGAIGRAWLPSGADLYDRRGGEASVQWEPADKPRVIVGMYPDITEHEDIWTSDGLGSAHTDTFAGELWSVGPTRDERRQLAVSRLPSFQSRGGRLGTLHIARDDVWYGAFPDKPSRGTDYVPTFTLLAAYADRPNEDRRVAVGKTSEVEIVSGLVPLEDPAALALVERVDGTDEIELRVRPILADLQLGEARAIPGTRGPASRLLRLPTCAATASGGIVRLDALVPRRVTIDGRKVVGYLTRLARITSDSACIERAYLVDNRADFHPLLVVAGNEGLGFARAGGVRCTLAPTKP